jgi:phosphonate transport system substrate-binding protein
VIAVANGADITPVGAMVDASEEEPGYQSYGVTKADNDDIESLADFKGRKVCFVDPGSTSGFLYPSAGLLEEDIDPGQDVEPIFAGGHDSSAISVKNGDCEAGFAFDKMVDEQLIKSGDIAEGDLKVVWKSEVIAGSPFTFRNKLPESLRTEISEILVEKVNIDWAVENDFCESADDCPLNDEDTWGYKAVDDEFYDGVREVCRVTKSAQCEGVS